MENPITVRAATLRDRSYVKSLAKRFSSEVGFLPEQAIVNRIGQGNVIIALENGQPAGYMLAAAELKEARHVRPIFQAAVQMDAQRRHHGLKLLDVLSTAAIASSQTMLQCWCREGLDANAFWEAAGFVKVALRDVNAVRGQPCVLWRKPLMIMPPETVMQIPANARHRGAAGRCCPRFAWDKLPTITPIAAIDVIERLTHLGRCA